MRRRRPVAAGGPPVELREFDPELWAGAAPDGDGSAPADLAFAAWRQARDRWRATHGWSGDSVAFAQEEVAAVLTRVGAA